MKSLFVAGSTKPTASRNIYIAMSDLLTLLFTAYFFATSAVLVWVSALICLVTAPFDRNRKLVHLFSCAWGYHYLLVNPWWSVRFVGREHLDFSKNYVLVANHQSYADILLLYGLFYPFKWVSKEEIFKIPFVGHNMLLNQYVKLTRGNMKSIKEMLKTCRNWLNQGTSVLVFPEGTRSEDGEIAPFRDGAFKLAADSNLPVVPVVVNGTHDVFPKHSKHIYFKAKIEVRILPPVYPQDFGNSSAQVRNHVHNLMIATLKEMREGKALAKTAS